VLEIVANKLGPFSQRPQQLPPGLLVQYDGMYFLWVHVFSGSGAGFIRLNDGEHFSSLPPEGQITVAAAVGVRMLPKSN
jgi:hypothetical protein